MFILRPLVLGVQKQITPYCKLREPKEVGSNEARPGGFIVLMQGWNGEGMAQTSEHTCQVRRSNPVITYRSDGSGCNRVYPQTMTSTFVMLVDLCDSGIQPTAGTMALVISPEMKYQAVRYLIRGLARVEDNAVLVVLFFVEESL